MKQAQGQLRRIQEQERERERERLEGTGRQELSDSLAERCGCGPVNVLGLMRIETGVDNFWSSDGWTG